MPITKTPSKSDNVSQGQPKASNVVQHEPNIFDINQAELTGACSSWQELSHIEQLEKQLSLLLLDQNPQQ